MPIDIVEPIGFVRMWKGYGKQTYSYPWPLCSLCPSSFALWRVAFQFGPGLHPNRLIVQLVLLAHRLFAVTSGVDVLSNAKAFPDVYPGLFNKDQYLAIAKA